MKRINSIIVRDRRYEIAYGDFAKAGSISFQLKKIAIQDNGRPEIEIHRSLIHEILHAISHEFGFIWLSGIANEEKNDKLAAAIVDTYFKNDLILEGKNVR
jgi:hypothetical protein